MRVLIAHNWYQTRMPSGENAVVDAEADLLERAGVDVVKLFAHSDDLTSYKAKSLLAAPLGPIYSAPAALQLRKILATSRPDVAHVHNVFPLLSPWIVRILHAAGVPVVHTVHNYRHACIAGTRFRDGAPCYECTVDSRFSAPALAHRCYRDSYLQSAAMSIGKAAHRSTWSLVSRFFVVSDLIRRELIEMGVPPSRIEWRPPFVDVGWRAVPLSRGPVLYVGRLDLEKGVELLLNAWTGAVADRWGRLIIAGSGPLGGVVQRRAAADSSVTWCGAVTPAAVRDLMAEASLVVVPSIWPEGFPRVCIEAASMGRPVAFCSGTSMEMLSDSGAGWSIRGDSSSWESWLLATPFDQLAAAGLRAREFYELQCGPERSLAQLLAAYQQVIVGDL